MEFPQISGPIITRYPPEPSGYLNMAHAKFAILNHHIAHQRPGGTMICRFDDTNPAGGSAEFQEAIVEDLRMLGITPDKITASSDYFQNMYEYALQLIRSGKAFTDDSSSEEIMEQRLNLRPSKHRNRSVQESLANFEQMKIGSTEGKRWCLRARIIHDSPNGTLRDPVIYRCLLEPHHRTGKDWNIYPTYDFCAPIVDSIEGVNVSLRSADFRERNTQYEWFQEALSLRKAQLLTFSRLSFTHTTLSKRKLTKIVEEGKVWGWDDPRMPTIRGVMRRGLRASALREFVLSQGNSQQPFILHWSALWALNKRHIDHNAPRHIAIAGQDAVMCTILGLDGPRLITMPKYHKNPELGTRNIPTDQFVYIEQEDAKNLTVGEEITLKSWGNVIVRKVQRATEDAPVTGITFELHLEGDFKTTTKRITWLAAEESNMVQIELVTFDHLLTKEILEEGEAIEDALAPVTESRVSAMADCNVTDLSHGDIVQFERKGYFILDAQKSQGERKLVFFDVPTGKAFAPED